jgi:hypothetical protein
MNIFDVLMGDNDAGADTIGDYLKLLLTNLWQEGECFSGKRPFGNSGWEYEIYTALVEAGIIDGKLDDDGYLETCDSDAGFDLIAAAIKGIKFQ